MLLMRSRCIFAAAWTAYPTAVSRMGRRTPETMIESGLRDMNMFGKPSTHMDRYDVGCGDHFALRSTPSQPRIWKGSCHDVSYSAFVRGRGQSQWWWQKEETGAYRWRRR